MSARSVLSGPSRSAIRLGWGLALLAAAAVSPAITRAQQLVRGLEPAFMDTTCSPCRDLFRYANGRWADTMHIPAAYTMYGAGEELEDRNEVALRKVLDAAVASLPAAQPGSNPWRLGVFYASCMDSTQAERDGTSLLQPVLARIGAIQGTSDLPAAIATLHSQGVAGMFGFGSVQDNKNSEEVIGYAGQGGLGLPDRDYYFRTDSVSTYQRGEYLAHVRRTFELLGEAPEVAARSSNAVLNLETAMATACMTRVERRDPEKTYHRMTREQLQALTPSFVWPTYLKTAYAPDVRNFNCAQPLFFHALDSLLTHVPVADWRTYLRWNAARAASPHLNNAFVNEAFRFSQVLSGTKELLPRWKRCLGATDENLGEVLGQEYVKEFFTPEAKQRALDMVNNLKAALRARIQKLEWMDEATKVQAMAKLDAFTVKIGYPDRWRDYSSMQLQPGSYVRNLLAANLFEWKRDLAKIGRPVDRNEWGMTPPTVNAYYSRSKNEIVFPAGILQPPYFDPNMDDAVNYAATGATIGHEMTHGFDDNGRRFDGRGNMRDWWTAKDAERYKAQAKIVEDQFNGMIAVDTVHVNGKLTLGENLSDLGGLAVAYDALERSLEGKPRKLIDGMTEEQRFFVAYGQEWREKRRPERMRTLALTDPHAPDALRVTGPVSNLAEFYRAFGCKQGDALWRPESERARVW